MLRPALFPAECFDFGQDFFHAHPARLFRILNHNNRNFCVLCRADLLWESARLSTLFGHQHADVILPDQRLVELCSKRSLHGYDLLPRNLFPVADFDALHPRKHTHKKSLTDLFPGGICVQFLAARRKKNVPRQLRQQFYTFLRVRHRMYHPLVLCDLTLRCRAPAES